MKKDNKPKCISEISNDDVKDLEFLSLTRNLENKNGLPHSVWTWLSQQYNEINPGDPVGKAMVSIINAILNQERIYFAISRRGLANLVKNDMNFKIKGVGFRNGTYAKILSKLQEVGFISKFHDAGNKRKATGFEVVDPFLLEYLDRKINREAQKQQVIDFISDKPMGTTSGTKYNNILIYKDTNIQIQQDIKSVVDASGLFNNLISGLNTLDKSKLSQFEAEFIKSNKNPDKTLSHKQIETAFKLLKAHCSSHDVDSTVYDCLISIIDSDILVTQKYDYLKILNKAFSSNLKPTIEVQNYLKSHCKDLNKLRVFVDHVLTNMKDTSWITEATRNNLKLVP